MNILKEDENLIHHFEFKSDASDSAGNAIGTLKNGAIIKDQSLILDGVDDFVEFDQQIIPLKGDYTIAFFAQSNLKNFQGISEIISQGDHGFYFGYDSQGIIRISDQWINTGIKFPFDGILHHFAIVVKESNTPSESSSKLFIDGILSAEIDCNIQTSSGGSNTRLGKQFGENKEFFNGKINDVRIYNTVLTEGEIQALAEGGLDLSIKFKNHQNIFYVKNMEDPCFEKTNISNRERSWSWKDKTWYRGSDIIGTMKNRRLVISRDGSWSLTYDIETFYAYVTWYIQIRLKNRNDYELYRFFTPTVTKTKGRYSIRQTGKSNSIKRDYNFIYILYWKDTERTLPF